jgi:hypothetical protein
MILMHPEFLQGKHFCDIPEDIFKSVGTHHKMKYTYMLSGYKGGDNNPMIKANLAADFRNDLTFQRTREDWARLHKYDLAEACSLACLSVTGTKILLIDRLVRASLAECTSSDHERFQWRIRSRPNKSRSHSEPARIVEVPPSGVHSQILCLPVPTHTPIFVH